MFRFSFFSETQKYAELLTTRVSCQFIKTFSLYFKFIFVSIANVTKKVLSYNKITFNTSFFHYRQKQKFFATFRGDFKGEEVSIDQSFINRGERLKDWAIKINIHL